ncbi:hypothetical protein pdam_00013399 [Pocillopora damicornis]|uniref:Uncharacterized protein n=1 Tax=Pocillopora damicornis TaxID=46731 RepID=A0A3M6TMF5_POCDA|nr:hypothetical protein pdam_00013399 [Pocillopora damicornis]
MEDLYEEQDHLIVEFLESLECLQEKREYLNASIREQFENAVVTFEMEKHCQEEERVLRKLVILKKKRRKT